MDEMTYSESARGVMITEERVIAELASHGFSAEDEIAECFAALDHSSPAYNRTGAEVWDARDVLAWLGY